MSLCLELSSHTSHACAYESRQLRLTQLMPVRQPLQTNQWLLANHRQGKQHTTRDLTDAKLCHVYKGSHTRLLSVGFQNWSRFLAVSLQVTWVINPAVGCHYFPPGLQLPLQTLKKADTNFTAWWTEAQWVWTVCLRLLPNSVATAV